MKETWEQDNEAVESQSHLMDYVYLLRKRKMLIGSVLFLSVLFTAILTFSMKPVYRSTAQLIIDKESGKSPLTGEQLEAESYFSQQLSFRTHFKIITSRPVLEKVLQQVEIPDESLEPELILGIVQTAKANVKRLLAMVFPAMQAEMDREPSADEELLKKIQELAGKINIEEVRDTRLLKIHVEDHDPKVARAIANSVADNYLVYDSRTRLQSSRKLMEWLGNELYEMKKKVEDAEREFQAFKEQEGIFSLEDKQEFNVQKIEETNARLVDTRAQRLEVEAKIEELKHFIESNRGGLGGIPSFLKKSGAANNVLDTLYAELLTAQVERRRLAGIYKPKHPEMQAIDSKIGELAGKVQQQVRKEFANLEAERSVLLAREQALQDATGSYEKDAIATNRKELQYAILEREVLTNRELYNTLLTKVKESNITDEITKTSLRIVEPAAVPLQPVKPKKKLNLLLSVILGLFGGVGLAFFLEYLDRTVHNKEEAERFLHQPVLAEIPKEETGRGKKNGKRPPNVMELPLNSRFSESFKTLATNLSFSGLDRNVHTCLITSSAPGEGKSTVALNLGLTMAGLGLKTLVVEADLRMPTMHEMLGFDRTRGLTEILVDTFNLRVRRGSTSRLGIGDIHKLLEMQEKTGVLHYRNGHDSFNVSFLKGQIMDVDWPTRPEAKRLGNLLVHSGRLTREQAGIALAKQKSTSQRLGQVLMDLGFIEPKELAGPLRLQIQENVRELKQAAQLDFGFEEEPGKYHGTADSKQEELVRLLQAVQDTTQEETPFLWKQIESCLFQPQGENKLWVLPCGQTPPNPSEMLASRRMKVLVQMLTRRFDFIVIDTPPVGTVTDAVSLVPTSDGVLLVIRAGDTYRDQVRRTLDQLRLAEAPLLGAVLNSLDFKRDPYYYAKYYRKYDYYYGDSGKKRKKSRKSSAQPEPRSADAMDWDPSPPSASNAPDSSSSPKNDDTDYVKNILS